jgi:hypothetical protein
MLVGGTTDTIGYPFVRMQVLEERRFSEELYHNDQPRPEKSAQMLFFCSGILILQIEQS